MTNFSRKTTKSCDDAIEISESWGYEGQLKRMAHIKNSMPIYYGRWWDVQEKNLPLKIAETWRLIRIDRLKTILG